MKSYYLWGYAEKSGYVMGNPYYYEDLEHLFVDDSTISNHLSDFVLLLAVF